MRNVSIQNLNTKELVQSYHELSIIKLVCARMNDIPNWPSMFVICIEESLFGYIHCLPGML